MTNLLRQYRQLFLAYVYEFFREPEVMLWTLLFPIAISWILGIAFSGERSQLVNVAWIQQQATTGSFVQKSFSVQSGHTLIKDSNNVSSSIILGSKSEGVIRYRFIPATPKTADVMMKKGEAILIVNDYPDSANFLFDPGNAAAHGAYLQISAALAGKPVQGVSVTKLDVKGLRYIDFFVPGLLAMGIMSSCMWGICFGMIERRSKKLLRRMVATPMKKSAFLASIVTARVILSIFESAVLYLFAWLYFGMQITGSIPALFLTIFAGNLCFAGIAIVLSSRTAKSEVGNGLINMVTLPMSICSGVFFSYHSFPDWIIPIIKAMPLTTLADSVRCIFLEGAGFMDVAPAIALLTGIGVITFSLGVKIFKWY
ncbi:MAG: ABC transporter permease [Ignavibacteria bacterium]|nr:ABC transporter permease [Ignavibacteria bacterium]